MKARPRGSTSGLKHLQQKTKETNTEEMLKIVDKLRTESPGRKWTYREVWSRAGLKSQVSLDSPWNIHIRQMIDEHNADLKLKLGIKENPTNIDSPPPSYMQNIRELKRERDAALSKIAVYAANAHYYKSKLLNLERQFQLYKLRSEQEQSEKNIVNPNNANT